MCLVRICLCVCDYVEVFVHVCVLASAQVYIRVFRCMCLCVLLRVHMFCVQNPFYVISCLEKGVRCLMSFRESNSSFLMKLQTLFLRRT